MYTEDELVPLSALQHLLFCERRAALVYLEQAWDENRATVEGRILHERVHEAGDETRGRMRIARGLRLVSRRLGLTGHADVVEFYRADADDGAILAGVSGRWRPFVVEYKRGQLRDEPGYDVQLCAQAICLEEMLGAPVPAGALFYGLSRRRHDVAFDDALRAATVEAARGLHALIDGRVTPPPNHGPKCQRCSLLALCLPGVMSRQRSVARHIAENTPSPAPDAVERLPAAEEVTPSDAVASP